jgi:DNA-binding GntR family transcriptional regulator
VSLDWTTFAPQRSATPLWRQFAAFVADAIEDGRLQPGDGLPGEHAISDYTGVSVDTIRRAFTELRAQGLITTGVGIGSFVAEKLTLALPERTT